MRQTGSILASHTLFLKSSTLSNLAKIFSFEFSIFIAFFLDNFLQLQIVTFWNYTYFTFNGSFQVNSDLFISLLILWCKVLVGRKEAFGRPPQHHDDLSPETNIVTRKAWLVKTTYTSFHTNNRGWFLPLGKKQISLQNRVVSSMEIVPNYCQLPAPINSQTLTTNCVFEQFLVHIFLL